MRKTMSTASPLLAVNDARFLDHMMQYVVSLQIIDRKVPKGGDRSKKTDTKPQIDAYMVTGFLIKFKRRIWWITAGHVIADIYRRMDDGNKVIKCRFGDARYRNKPSEHESVPFDIGSAACFWTDREDLGMDCGAILVPVHQARLLLFGGARFFNWRDFALESDQFNAFAMLGFPNVGVSDNEKPYRIKQIQKKAKRSGGGVIMFSYGAPLLSLRPVDPPPELIKRYPRRYFRVLPNVSKHDGRRLAVKHVDGMSGGPVLGLRVIKKVGIQYKLIGIQSTQSDLSGTTCVCRPKLFLRLMWKEITRRYPDAK